MTDKESRGSPGTSGDQPATLASRRETVARPVLTINPPRDQAFAAAAEALLDAGLRSLSTFQDVLRQHFPDAVVRARDLSGESGGVWYVFRDGRWVNGKAGSDAVGDLPHPKGHP